MSLRRLLRPLLAMTVIGLVAACAADPTEGSDEDDSALIAPGQAPMTKARLDSIIAGSPNVRSLDQLPAALPKEFLINVTLKHGKLRTGENGHLVEKDVSQSSDPMAPRAILWDERSGFAVSYNGGVAGQTEGQRLDVLEFDDAAKEFRLEGLTFDGKNPPATENDANIKEDARKCSHCHGTKLRPVFAMYPDWPSFYGSDNDELTDTTKEVERLELTDFKAFRSRVDATRSPRYAPLFDRANVAAQLRGTQLYPSFPYRQDTATEIHNVSRAFAFRPSLRLGILMNRNMAQAAAKRIIDHPNFAKFGPLFLHGLLECRWPNASSLASSSWMSAVATENGAAPKTVASGTSLHYRDLLKIFDLEVRDLDIRYSYNHAGYANEDASSKLMEVGYIDGTYWNSYFDGSATIDELVAMHLFKRLSADPAFKDIASLVPNPDGLEVKYSRLTERFAFDKNFFQEMDKKGRWIPIPYPRAKLDSVHHREGYPERFASQHAALCGALQSHLVKSGGGAAPPSAAACPASCVASSFCKDNPNASSAIKVGGLPCVVAGAGGCQPCR